MTPASALFIQVFTLVVLGALILLAASYLGMQKRFIKSYIINLAVFLVYSVFTYFLLPEIIDVGTGFDALIIPFLLLWCVILHVMFLLGTGVVESFQEKQLAPLLFYGLIVTAITVSVLFGLSPTGQLLSFLSW